MGGLSQVFRRNFGSQSKVRSFQFYEVLVFTAQGETAILEVLYPCNLLTLPETNSQLKHPENGWLEDFLVSLWGPASWQVRTVSFREGKNDLFLLFGLWIHFKLKTHYE